MGTFTHFLMMHEVTANASKHAKPSIKPFADYLRAGHPFNEHVRKWLLEMLSDNGVGGVRLVTKMTKGRKRTTQQFEKDIAAFDYFDHLRGAQITREICVRYASSINAPPVEFITRQKQHGGSDHFTVDRTTYIVRAGRTELKFIKGRRVPEYIALKLTAVKFNRSTDALRKTIAAINKAKAVG